jgi:2-polyprenyl-3-methyl-5-hydroxy-6-metoxy-1,4-benzoquinol methylase
MKKIIYKNDGTIPVENILCTTYQMRNFYNQFRDGFFTKLDIMNYIQHFKAVELMKKNFNILDVCCGRGLLLPLIRYYRKNINKYVGVDIKKENAIWVKKNICNNKEIDKDKYYPFKTEFIESNVSEMSKKIKDKFDLIVYTSAIEHMQFEDGRKSILECKKLLKENGILFLSCPNTPENQNGFDVRYKAHVYEWKISELKNVLKENKFKIKTMVGLVGDSKDLNTIFSENENNILIKSMINYFPKELLKVLFFISYPEKASEVLLICEHQKGIFI